MPTTREATSETERRFLFERGGVRMDAAPAGVDSPGVIYGYSAVFYREGDPDTEFTLWPGPDGIIERIAPGAFDEVAADDVRCLFNHESSLILGRSKPGTVILSVDSVGLFYRCTLPNTTAGRDVAETINRGDVSGGSFQFSTFEQEWAERENEPTIRTLTKLKVYDVGPVTFPAYKATTVGVRGVDGAKAELERFRAERQALERQAIRKAARRKLIRERLTNPAQRNP